MIKEYREIKRAVKTIRITLQNMFFGYDIKATVKYRKSKRAIVRIYTYGLSMYGVGCRYGFTNEIRFIEWRAIKDFWPNEIINDFSKNVNVETLRIGTNAKMPRLHTAPFVKIPPV